MVRNSVREIAIKTSRSISASHTLKGMGKCEKLHGHTWKVDVEITADPEHIKNDGVLVDFSHIKKVIDKYDHQHLNDYMEVPTAENFACKILDEINEFIMFANSIEITVWESPDSCAVAYEMYESVPNWQATKAEIIIPDNLDLVWIQHRPFGIIVGTDGFTLQDLFVALECSEEGDQIEFVVKPKEGTDDATD